MQDVYCSRPMFPASKSLLAILLTSLLCMACVTQPDSEVNTDLSTAEAVKYPMTDASTKSAVVKYIFQKQQADVEWVACGAQKAATGTFVIVNMDDKALSPEGFCSSWLAQVFLREKFQVIAVNRPGYGRSTGADDFGGPHSVAAMEQAVADAQKTVPEMPPIAGVWGAQSGAIAAAFFAKGKSFRTLVLGNGFYDLEVAGKTKRVAVAERIAAVASAEGDMGIERRSIGWDVEGLPKKIFVYHGQTNDAFAADQAESFRNALATAEYKVSLQLLDGIGYELPEPAHIQLLETFLRTL